MRLICGGAFQGKLGFARELSGFSENEFADGKTCSLEELLQAKAVYAFHECVRRFVKPEDDWSQFARRLILENPDLLIVTDELGYGVVPMEREDRAWREHTGRICTELAAHSECVYRVVCGIGMRLK